MLMDRSHTAVDDVDIFVVKPDMLLKNGTDDIG